MIRLLPRAAGFALLALLTSAIVSAIALLVLVGLPDGNATAASFRNEAVGRAAGVDLIVGGLVMLIFGWLAARPFKGRDALVTGILVAVIYILIDLAIIVVVGDPSRVDRAATGLAYAVKTVAAVIGALIAGRARTEVAAPDQP